MTSAQVQFWEQVQCQVGKHGRIFLLLAKANLHTANLSTLLAHVIKRSLACVNNGSLSIIEPVPVHAQPLALQGLRVSVGVGQALGDAGWSDRCPNACLPCNQES